MVDQASKARVAVIPLALLVGALAFWLNDPARAAETQPTVGEVARLRVEVVGSYPHDPRAYTQGLLWQDGSLYESTGQYGQSSIRRVDRETGEVLASRSLPSEMFGEGLASVGDRLLQLTWREGEALVWARQELEEIGRHRYDGEGWGLCFDGRNLVMSDGSSVLTLRDPTTFEVVRQLKVTMGDGAVGRLNELECVDGAVYANVYTTDWIVRVDSANGEVEALIDASGLLTAQERRGADVLNGIAHDPETDLFYLTGKLWPRLFAVRFVEVPTS